MQTDESVPSPIHIPFDYTKHRENTTNPAIKRILAIVSENSDKVTFSGEFQMQEFNQRFDDVAKEIITVLVEENVAEADRSFIFTYIQQIFMILGDNIAKQVDGHKREILSRTIGKRDPGSDKFNVDYCNFGDILSTLIDVREKTGNNNEDYFFITKSILEDNNNQNEN